MADGDALEDEFGMVVEFTIGVGDGVAVGFFGVQEVHKRIRGMSRKNLYVINLGYIVIFTYSIGENIYLC